jgi:uncharacterized protein (TIRG00374 family)
VRKSVILQILISLAAILIVIYLSDFSKVAEIMGRANPLYLAVAAILYFMINLCMAYRITLVLREVGERLSLTDTLEASLSGMLASDFTPGRTGYFATAFLMKANYKTPLDKSMLSILGPQLFEFSFKCITGALALWYIMELLASRAGGEARFFGMLIGVAAFISMILIMALLLFSRNFVRKLAFIRIFPYGEHTHSLLLNMQKNSKAVRKLIPHITVISLVTWFIKSIEWLFISKSIGMQINSSVPELVFFAFLHPLVTMLQFIPTPTLAGMGLSEGGAAVILALFGVPPYESVAFALLARSMNIAVDLLGVKGAAKVINRI